MRNNVDRNESEYKTEFARRLAASFFSMQLGVTLQTAYKKYAENNAVGDYWLTVADAIIADHTGQKNFAISDISRYCSNRKCSVFDKEVGF